MVYFLQLVSESKAGNVCGGLRKTDRWYTTNDDDQSWATYRWCVRTWNPIGNRIHLSENSWKIKWAQLWFYGFLRTYFTFKKSQLLLSIIFMYWFQYCFTKKIILVSFDIGYILFINLTITELTLATLNTNKICNKNVIATLN